MDNKTLLHKPLNTVSGVGEKTFQQFKQAQISTIHDLINFFPRRYEDYSQLIKIEDIKPGKVTIKAHCEKINTRIVRRGLSVTTAILSDGTDRLQAVWFNQPYRQTQLTKKTDFYFSGEYGFSYQQYQLMNPSVEQVSQMTIQTGRLLPVYKAIQGLKSSLVRKIIASLQLLILNLPETLPVELVDQQKLLSRRQAIFQVHFPRSEQEVALARQRLAFEEVFQIILASYLNKQQHQQLKGIAITPDETTLKKFVENLPFQLTDDQRRSAWQIILDLGRTTPMNRLLQGDVGSGKTVVAGLVAYCVAQAGFQTALMAPTEILAKQHAETISRLMKPFNIQVGLLTSSVRGEARRLLYRQVKQGEVKIIIGTHSLIQNDLEFANLALVVIDEQHRFGVEQRQKLLTKTKQMPHLLTMTATPIPRSLQLTFFGELDVSVIKELPKHRLPIQTKIFSPNSRQQLHKLVEAELKQGRQAYFIYRLIDQGLSGQKNVLQEFKKLKNLYFKDYRVAMLHGRMKPAEKDAIMKDFLAHKYDILVSTTVIEVGIDVPNATVIVIEEADQFGLSQLHQLRGRVGRGQHQSYCYLVNSSSLKPTERLRQLETSNDGFYLAEVDLKLRGPGEIYGIAQHGDINLKVASFADLKLLKQAQAGALFFVKNNYNLLQYKELSKAVKYYQRLTTLN